MPAKKKNRIRRSVSEGVAYVQATFNNTIITLTDEGGGVLVQSSAGASGFRGPKKSTPYAAGITAKKAMEKASVFGLQKVKVFIKGVGPGRDQAVRGLHGAGLTITSIVDVTPIPHNGCRKKKPRRV